MSWQEIADQLGIKPRSVQRTYHKAMAKLRENLKNTEDAEALQTLMRMRCETDPNRQRGLLFVLAAIEAADETEVNR